MASTRLRAFVFDAYGTLFDPLSVEARAESLAPGHGAALARGWRAKQLEYTWLASLMAGAAYRRPDFAAITAMALDYTLAALVLPLGPEARASLADEYLRLAAYPDARRTLEALARRPRWILSNGTRAMLDPLVAGSGLADCLDGTLSVDEVDVYKPSPRVYALASERLGFPSSSIGFVSANGWDAAGAKCSGMRAFWINRTGAPIDRHAPAPDWVVGSLAEVAAIAARI
ncbi:MAG: haloacid dehalogenase type II [Burkholderiales bacterium]